MPFHSMSYVIILHLPRLLSFRTHFFVEEKNRAIVFKQNIWLCVCALNACRAGTRTFSQCISMCAFSLSAVLCVRCLHSQQAYTHTHTHTETREFFESERHLLIVTHTHTEWMGDRERERCMLWKRCISITKLRVSAFCMSMGAFMLILYSGKHNSYIERTKETKGTCERGTEILTRTQEKNYYNSARKKRSKTEDVCIRQTHTIFFSLSLSYVIVVVVFSDERTNEWTNKRLLFAHWKKKNEEESNGIQWVCCMLMIGWSEVCCLASIQTFRCRVSERLK